MTYKIIMHPDADPAILAALVEREDVILVDRLPEFAHYDTFRFRMDPPVTYANGTATVRHMGVDWARDENTERDAWNAAVEARKATRQARRAARPRCEIDGCTRPATAGVVDLCARHREEFNAWRRAKQSTEEKK